MYRRLTAPLTVQLEVTGECTSECLHCYNFWRNAADRSVLRIPSGTLSDESAVAILQKLGAAEVFSLTITGGEPLLNYSATLMSLNLARSLNMAVSLNSNLILLTADKAVSLRQAGLASVLTSILGPTPEVHDSLTQRKNSFEKLDRKSVV